ncbi:hypothetical protein ACI8B_100092 [Acinetobacter proteolyticus]|uniref:Uncharacterized protein n=1 Tax=Acinetobacter proteolyticus TaxID=1776741 RepID=A0A653K0L4_9GAMM|nr:hypothetical protein ACI8B_100092 [Acinetobacter proteolyticus]
MKQMSNPKLNLRKKNWLRSVEHCHRLLACLSHHSILRHSS